MPFSGTNSFGDNLLEHQSLSAYLHIYMPHVHLIGSVVLKSGRSKKGRTNAPCVTAQTDPFIVSSSSNIERNVARRQQRFPLRLVPFVSIPMAWGWRKVWGYAALRCSWFYLKYLFLLFRSHLPNHPLNRESDRRLSEKVGMFLWPLGCGLVGDYGGIIEYLSCC